MASKSRLKRLEADIMPTAVDDGPTYLQIDYVDWPGGEVVESARYLLDGHTLTPDPGGRAPAAKLYVGEFSPDDWDTTTHP